MPKKPENGTTPSKSKGLSRNCWVFRDKGPAEAVFGKEPFGDGAPATHRLIEEELIPEMQTLFPSLKGGERILGDKEARTRNRTMATVEDCIREYAGILAGTEGLASTLEWNPGNHFVEADRRTARAFLWAIQ